MELAGGVDRLNSEPCLVAISKEPAESRKLSRLTLPSLTPSPFMMVPVRGGMCPVQRHAMKKQRILPVLRSRKNRQKAIQVLKWFEKRLPNETEDEAGKIAEEFRKLARDVGDFYDRFQTKTSNVSIPSILKNTIEGCSEEIRAKLGFLCAAIGAGCLLPGATSFFESSGDPQVKIAGSLSA
ncbi:12762_t:CDS:2, partial [Acaulospora colombiana]